MEVTGVLHHLSLLVAIISIITLISLIFLMRKSNVDDIIDKLFQLEEVVSSKPNFIVIVADDLGSNSMGYNSDVMEFVTPFLTYLGKSGIILDNFYSQEVCSPARASLLTGRYPISLGMQYRMVSSTMEWGLPLDETTIVDLLTKNNYATHAIGKWHLGYFSPLYLPTARGFDTFTGFLNGETHYFSKMNSDYPTFSDLIECNTTCYYPYDRADKHEYSTSLYKNRTLEIIDQHEPSLNSLFLFLSFQAVHGPFIEAGDSNYMNGLPDEYIPEDVLNIIHSSVLGSIRQEYVKALYLMDAAVKDIYAQLSAKDMLKDTYILFLSDNGGCSYGGGTNGPLRGMKGSLFEGGVKVESFVYSPLMSNVAGNRYNGLVHMVDWFPTILSLAGIDYDPEQYDGKPLDGIDQSSAFEGDLEAPSPRTEMLYNLYLNVTDYPDFDIWTAGGFAVRNERYKLMHTYDDPIYGGWSNLSESSSDDDLGTENDCMQTFLSGNYTYFLFDLADDPYEFENLYGSASEEHVTAKAELYELIEKYSAQATQEPKLKHSKRAKAMWEQHDKNMLPWANLSDLENIGFKAFPVLCRR